MHWLPDPSAGAWLRERLDDPWNSSMHSVVPHGYPAYARILHPASVRSLPDRPVPTDEEWERMPEAERRQLIDRLVDSPATWAETAEAFGTVLHPLAQWQRIVRTPIDGDWRSRIAPDGREFTAPMEGELPADVVARVAAHLRSATTTPEAGVAALWEGFGGLLGHYGHAPSRAFLTLSDDPTHQALLDRSMHDPFNNVFRKPTWHDGILSKEISEAPRFETRDRAYVLFSAGVEEFTDSDWILRAPWRDFSGEQHGFPPSAQSPSILWPEDRAWVLVSEIDFDSTVVAGSAELVAALCADPALEAFPLPEGADLHWDADDVNR
ncbi:hypothetical protein AUC47_09810 [Microbacterium sp. SZ1]|uniref:hypothetical protein n=1 Tax=Microbacterium sp. SZ1 TaxID=1849736 RepID=UPI000BBC36FB|nr:hypothetical protein [Microbacterium sp. SZ1]PCE16226.1 hypothetical protein AUC47_09810 [Microbacterium sp. SZ1]